MTPDIGFAVTVLRQAEGLTQRELARRAHTSRPHVCRVEIGEYQPTVATALRLAGGLNVPAWVLFRLAESRQGLRP